jgi:CRP-like cAMP-binding protein
MKPEVTLFQRRRPLTANELEVIPWLKLLSAAERERAVEDLKVTDADAGDFVCRTGRTVTYWFGVVDGLLKMSTDNVDGQTMTFTGIPPGGWFGEGTALKRESYRYNFQPVRESLVAGLHVDTFHWLLDHSIGFNRFVMNQLNERLGQFIAAREIDRMTNPNIRVARSLAALFNPVPTPVWAPCCASPSRSWRIWWACRASASTRP